MRYRIPTLAIVVMFFNMAPHAYPQSMQSRRWQAPANYTGNVTFEANITILIRDGFQPGVDSIGVMMNFHPSQWTRPIVMTPVPGDTTVYSVTVGLSTPVGGDSNYVYWKLYAWGGEYGSALGWEANGTGPGWYNGSNYSPNRYFVFDGVDTTVGPVTPYFSLPIPIPRGPSDDSLVPPSPTLNWGYDGLPNPGPEWFHLQISADPSFSSPVFSDSGYYSVDTSLSQAKGLLGNTMYYWRLVKSFSPMFVSGTMSFVTLPQPPAHFTVSSRNLRITLQWQDSLSPNNLRYRIYKGNSPGAEILVDSTNTITYTDSNVTGDKEYYYRVTAEDSSGNEGPPTAELPIFDSPFAPLLASPSSGSQDISWSPVLTWNPETISAPLTYRVQLSLDSSFTTVLLDDSLIRGTFDSLGSTLTIVDTLVGGGDSSQTTHIITGTRHPVALASDTVYYWRVSATNEGGEGPYSSVWHFRTKPQPPHAATLSSIYQPDAGSALSAPLTFSSAGSFSTNGEIDSTFWYVNDSLVGRQAQLTDDFRQGTNVVKLVVEDNFGGEDSSFAVVNRSKFKFDLAGPVYAGPSMLGDDVLYVIGSGDAVYRVDTTGNKIYSLQVGGDVKSSSSIAYDTTVYIASSDKNLYAFSESGISKWPALPLGGVMTSTPAIDSSSNAIYIGISNNNFFAVNRTAGKVAWNYFVDAPIVGCAAITLDRKLVFASVKGTIYGFDLAHLTSSPSPAWQLALSDSIYGSPAVDDSGNVYFASASGKVYCITLPRSGPASIVWQAQTGAAMTASPVIDGFGTIYVGASDGNLYAIGSRSGNIKWAYSTGAPIYSTATISNVNMIYVGNHSGKVCALDTSSTLHWYYQDSSSVDAPLLYHNGTLYVGTSGGRLVAFFDDADSTLHSIQKAFKLKTVASVAPVPVWGTFQGNSQRTGLPVGHTVTEIRNLKAFVPRSFALYQNYPNPFNPSTTIRFDLKEQSTVTLDIYNVLGQRVLKEDYGTMNSGEYNKNIDLSQYASGVYFYRLQARNFTAIRKFILIK